MLLDEDLQQLYDNLISDINFYCDSRQQAIIINNIDTFIEKLLIAFYKKMFNETKDFITIDMLNKELKRLGGF